METQALTVYVCECVRGADAEVTWDETSLIFHPLQGIDLEAIRR